MAKLEDKDGFWEIVAKKSGVVGVTPKTCQSLVYASLYSESGIELTSDEVGDIVETYLGLAEEHSGCAASEFRKEDYL